MAKTIILTESQFRDYMHLKLNEAEEQKDDVVRDLSIDEIKEQVKRMIDYNFFIEFPSTGSRYTKTNLSDKAGIIEAICLSADYDGNAHPKLLTNGSIRIIGRGFGLAQIENLIEAR